MADVAPSPPFDPMNRPNTQPAGSTRLTMTLTQKMIHKSKERAL